ncbi:hypothetical protein JR316_0010834 [Psilocybe cubensis]|uniref:Uncharacterized protein n=2 Tax=Psilocybe cubensis TaxID=181762 RepID=A0A8H8CJG1_PSICU|nr:hypothetical protein JR316_0010834 [Psilocybe cubensis]KAH9476918.1 hypothetical protein JR316_0010834 [Psilocybe cubensis]
MPSHSLLPLLLCNRQINTEVLALMELLTSTSHDWMCYELDCEIVDEVKIVPTWVHIPPIHPKHGATISCVYVTFRLSGQRRFLDPETAGRVEFWSHGNGGPSRIIRGLEAILTRFLKWGPNFLNLSKNPQRSRFKYFRRDPEKAHKLFTVMVDKLVLNFATPPISPEEMRLREENGEIINPRQACGIVRRYFDILLDGGYMGDSFEKRDFIVARVGHIQWEIDGQIE